MSDFQCGLIVGKLEMRLFAIEQQLQNVGATDSNRGYGVEPPQVDFKERDNVTSCKIDIDHIDNEFTIAINGLNPPPFWHGTAGDPGYHEDITGQLKSGANVVVITLDNHGHPGGGSPAEIRGKVTINNTDVINLNHHKPGGYRQGVIFQQILLLNKP